MVGHWPHATANRIISRRGKKKHQSELTRYFPARFGNSKEQNYAEQFRAYLLAKTAHAIEPTAETEAALQKAFSLVVSQHKPACFRPGQANVITRLEKVYGKLLVTLAECGCQDPERLTVFQFYTWLETLEEKYEEQKKALMGSKHGPKRL